MYSLINWYAIQCFIEKNTKKNNDIFKNNENITIYEIENELAESELPIPRKFKSIHIDFTPRHFPTPSRESTKAEELEVKLKRITLCRNGLLVIV